MCEIQIIQKLGEEKIDKADIGEFFKMMCFGSMDNNDAFGVFNHKYMFKKGGAFDASKLNERSLIRDNFIIGHNRYATSSCKIRNPDVCDKKSGSIPKSTSRKYSGVWDWSFGISDNFSNVFLPTFRHGVSCLDDEEEELPTTKTKKAGKKINTYMGTDRDRNHHPFELGDFVLIHNGVISNAQRVHKKYNFNTTISTDSYVIIELIDYFFKKSKIKNRVKRIASSIQTACSELGGGYSVVLYDKREKKMFYFKNLYTSFSLYKYGNSILCGSTSKENLDYLYFGMEKEKIKLKNKRIYLITSNKKNPVLDVTPSSVSSSGYSGKSAELYNILVSEYDYDERTKKVKAFLKKRLGFVPVFDFSYKLDLKIGTNNGCGIKEKINKIVKNPRKRWGWYIISPSDLEKPKKKVKLDKMKGGKK